MHCRNLFTQSVFEYLREFHMHWLVLLLNIVVTVNPSFASFPKPGYVQKKNTLNYGFCPSNGPFFSSFCSPVFTVSHPDRQSASLHPRWGWLINWLETSTSPWYGSVFDWCCVLGLGVSACVCVCEKDSRHYNRSHMRFLWQRVDSLHWTMKCSNLVLLWIDGLWMSTRWGQLWYMGIPSSPWVLLWSAGVSLAQLFWLSQLCLNLHSQSKVIWWSKATICKASFNGVLLTKLEHSFFCLHSRRNEFFSSVFSV